MSSHLPNSGYGYMGDGSHRMLVEELQRLREGRMDNWLQHQLIIQSFNAASTNNLQLLKLLFMLAIN